MTTAANTPQNSARKPEHALAWAMFRAANSGAPGDEAQKEKWNAEKDGLRKQARAMMRSLDRQGFELGPKSA